MIIIYAKQDFNNYIKINYSYIVVCHTVRYRYPPTNGGTNRRDRRSGSFRSVRFPLAPAQRNT